MGRDLFEPPFAVHAIDPALFGSHPGEGAPLSSKQDPDAASATACSHTDREAFDPSEHVDDVAGSDVRAQEAAQEYSLRGDLVNKSEELPLDTASHNQNVEDTVMKDVSQLSEGPISEVGVGCEDGDFDPHRVLAVFEVHASGQHDGSEENERGGQSAEPFVAVHLYVGQLPDPTADDPVTPPLAQNAVRIEDVLEIMQEQVQDPARGWGVLMSDVRKVLTPERFIENAGSRITPPGYVTWPVFVRTVLHMLHR